MKVCKNCNEPIEWDAYWTTWDHTGRASNMTAELCQPELGFDASKVAEL